jgi:hypothetical protein
MFVTAVLFTLVAAAVIIYLIVIRPSSKVKNLVNRMPGPPTVPLFGNALQLKADGAGIDELI